MIALALQAAAEYVGVMIANGVRAIGTAGQDAGRWIGEHPVELGVGLIVLVALRKLVRRR